MTLLDKVLNGYKAADPRDLLIEELQRENAEMNARLSRLSVQLAQRRMEGDKLRRAVRRQKPTYSWLAERAALDAKGIYMLQVEGIQPSRKNAADILQMPTRRWQWARALARLAGIHDGQLFSEDTDARQLVQRLNEHIQYAAQHPDIWRQYRAK
jgi:hypothetical protein